MGAVEHLSEACEMLGKLYGETAPETGDAYFYYGKALLELGRLEAGVIDNVLDGDDSEENSEADAAGPSVSGETEEDEKVKDNESIGSNDAGTSDVKDSTDKKKKLTK